MISFLTSCKCNNINCDSVYGHNPCSSDLLVSKIRPSLQFLKVQGNQVTKQIKIIWTFFILSQIPFIQLVLSCSYPQWNSINTRRNWVGVWWIWTEKYSGMFFWRTVKLTQNEKRTNPMMNWNRQLQEFFDERSNLIIFEINTLRLLFKYDKSSKA